MVSPNVQVTLEGGSVDSTTALYNPEGTYLGARYRINTLRAGVSADTQFGVIAFDFYRNQAHNSYQSILGPEDLVNTVYVAKLSDLAKLDADNTVRVGVEYRNNSAVGPSVFGGTIGYQVYSADAMWDWQILPSLSLVNAGRIDHLSLGLTGLTPPGAGLTIAQYDHAAFTEPSFNSGLVWKVTDNDTLRLTAARGLQVPSLIDYAFQIVEPGYGTILYGNPTLAPTAVWNYELAYDRALAVLGSTVRTGVFFQQNQDLLAASFQVPFGLQPNNPAVSQSSNVGSSHEVGLEIGIKGKSAAGWRWNASYSFASITDDLLPGFNTPNLEFRRGTPQHTVILGGGYSVGRWELDAQGRWQSEFQDFRAAAGYTGFQAVEINNYVTFSARVGFRVTDFLTLSGTAEQFNTPALIQSAGPPVERRFIAAVTAHF